MCKENAYFTVEAALVLPMAMGTMLFVVYMFLFQYNRCLMEQDTGAMALWGNCVEFSDTAMLEEQTRQRMEAMYRDKYVAWDITSLNVVFQQNRFSVKGAGQLTFPFLGWNFWNDRNVWGMEVDYEFQRLSPVTFIRLCHWVQNALDEM